MAAAQVAELNHPPMAPPSVPGDPPMSNKPDDADAKPGPRTIGLGLNRSYAADWTVQDALRELYQNWKDAILQTTQMDLLDFLPRVTVSPNEDELIITVEQRPAPAPGGDGPPTQTVLGYIRFNRIQGSAEFTNFGSRLDPQCLEMGHTTKRDDGRLAGGHGEGLKIAALVLARENHHVRISTNDSYWNFGFNGQSKANFYCRLTPARGRADPGRPSGPATFSPSLLKVRLRDDVSVQVGGPKGRLPPEEFRAWMTDTVDLHAATGRVRTPFGDLLLEPVYLGRLYLKGIRVPEPNLDGRAVRFGYNLFHGRVDRDRQRLLDPDQVTENLHRIWGYAIATNEAVALPRYLQLFRDHPASVDVRDADRAVTEATAQRLWAVLRQGSVAAGVFYCTERNPPEVLSMIQRELEQKPCVLPDVLWRILRKHHLVRSPLEELHRRFECSRPVDVPETAYAQEVAHLLRGLLASDPSTEATRAVFVHSPTHAVDVAYRADQNLLYAHEKWLHPATDAYGDPNADPYASDPLVCHHRVGELYSRALALILGPSDGASPSPRARGLLAAAHRKLHQAPCMLQISPAAADGGLRVSFYTGHTLVFVARRGARVHYLVVLHRADCASRVMGPVYWAAADLCRCSRTVVPLDSRTAVFSDVGDGPWAPMVVRMADDGGQAADHSPLPWVKGEDGALVGWVQPVVPSARAGVDPGPVPARGGAPGPATISSPASDPMSASRAPAPKARSSSVPPIPAERFPPPIDGGPGLHGRDDSAVQPGEGLNQEMVTFPPLPDHPIADTHLPDRRTPCFSPGAPDEAPPLVGRPCNPSRPGASPIAPAATLLPSSLVTASPAVEAEAEARPSDAAEPPTEVRPDASWPATTHAIPADATLSGRPSEQSGGIGGLDDAGYSPTDGPLPNPGMPTDFPKGSYVRVDPKVPKADSPTRWILFIHDILPPSAAAAAPASPRLLATKYSFRADHPAIGARCPTAGEHELLLHFRDAAHMADAKDAEVIDADTVVPVPTERGSWTVQHTADPARGFFARYAIRDGSPLAGFFVTPLAPALLGEDHQNNTPGPHSFPRFSALPAPSVLDLSPIDPGLSAGFAQAGCRIQAAIGPCHPEWKHRFPEATVHEGDPVSVIDGLKSSEPLWPGTGEDQAPRIMAVSGWAQPPRSTHARLTPAHSPPSPVEALRDGSYSLRLCGLAALSPTVSPDFIALVMSHAHQQHALQGSLARTVDLLLGSGFSVTLRAFPSPRGPAPSLSPLFLLLAGPRGTPSQWIDHAFADLLLDGEADSSPPAIGPAGPGDLLAARPPPDGVPEDAARRIATVISRITGEFAKRGMSIRSAPAADHDYYGGGRAKKARI